MALDAPFIIPNVSEHCLNCELVGSYIRLEPLDYGHTQGLAAASAKNPDLYRWSPIPQGEAAVTTYIDTALEWRDAGTAIPYATVRQGDNEVIGSTRFWQIEYWPWPEGHPQHGKPTPDVCEIGWTWLAESAIRTPANTEAKLLMLTHAFETMKVIRVSFHTDARNARSRAAIERIGGKYEGIIRAHRIAADFTPRDSCRYSIMVEEWPEVQRNLLDRLHY